MPVPQTVNFLVEQTSCLFMRMVQDVSYYKVNCYRPFVKFFNSRHIGGIWPECVRGWVRIP